MSDICIFSAHYLPNIGGIERFTYYLAKWLTKSGNKVTVVTNDLFDGLQKHEVKDGVEIFRMPCYRLMNGRYPVARRNKEFKELNNELESRRYDLVVINARFYTHSVYGADFAKKTGAKCITIEHGSAYLTVNNPVLDFFGRIYEHLITAVLKTKCKEYYGVSEAAAKWSGNFGIVSRGIIYNSIDLEEIKEKADNPVMSYREEYSVDKNRKIVSFAGRLVSGKGAKELAEAVKRMDNVTLFIAGDGPDKREVIEAVKGSNNIILLGKIDFDHVIALMKDSDIFCLPTAFTEGLPTAVLEAAMCDTFTVATGFGGTKEIMPDNSYGYIMEDNKPETIYEAIEYSLSHPEYMASCKEKSRERVKQTFNWARTVKYVERIAASK